LDIAKNVFQVHGIDASEKVFVRKQLRRSRDALRYGVSLATPRSRQLAEGNRSAFKRTVFSRTA
jgi:hypothetical protein